MSTFTQFLKRHSLAAGLMLMFLLTWPIDLANNGVMPYQVPFAVYILLGYGFVIASIIMTWLTLGKEGVITLLRRYLLWRIDWKWYLVAFFLAPVLFLLGVYLNAALTQTPPDYSTVMAYKIFGDTANLPLFILPFFLVDLLTNGEEIGWRGYILPRLQVRYSALTSSLILGVVWGLWHLPKYLPHLDLVAFAWFMVHIISFAVLLTWLYNNTKGSLLLVVICHASSNTAGLFLPVDNVPSSPEMGAYILFALLEVAAAVVVTVVAGSARLLRSEPKQMVASRLLENVHTHMRNDFP
jgi:membrane protease YdiL (CAAX protease family)